MLDKVKSIIVSWASCFHQSRGFPTSLFLMNWKEIAFSSSIMKKKNACRFPPPLGSFKLNVDGGAFGNPANAGLGSVIRHGSGKPILSYSGPAGVCPVNRRNP